MDEYTATENAYKNGKAAGFAEGLAAAGIAPIQWRAVGDHPVPEREDVILWTDDGDYYAWKLARSSRVGFLHLVTDRCGAAVWIPVGRVRFWCPVQSPISGLKGGGED